MIDLAPLIAKSEPPLNLMCFYAKDMALDVWHSTRILEAGLPTLYTIGVTGTSHLIFMPLIARGVFDVVMKPLAQGASMQESFTLLRGFFPRQSVCGQRRHTRGRRPRSRPAAGVNSSASLPGSTRQFIMNCRNYCGVMVAAGQYGYPGQARA